MKSKTLWIVSAFLLFVHLALQYVTYVEVDLSNSVLIVGLIIDIISNLVLVLVIGVILGLLTALIPYKQRAFKEKFKSTFPFGISAILVGLIIMYSFLLFSYNSSWDLSISKYDEIEIPDRINCSSLHEGKFETEDLLIERIGTKQIQVNKTTREEKVFVIEWLSDCEYRLIQLNTSKKLKVKIVSVNEFNYECYVVPEANAGKYPNKQIITIK